MTERMRVDLWSDFSCPWCYLGAARLHKAVAASEHADRVDVVTRSFELDPAAPAEPAPLARYLAKRLGVSEAEALQSQRSMAPLAEEEGLPYEADRVHANTFDAHRVLQLATSEGRGPAFLSEFQRGLFGGRSDAFDPAFLVATAERVGVAPSRAARVLESDEFADAVHRDEAEARRLGVTGVPFTVVDGRHGIPGAVPATTFTEVIDTAWNERSAPAER